jgi:hypothetical protein
VLSSLAARAAYVLTGAANALTLDGNSDCALRD